MQVVMAAECPPSTQHFFSAAWDPFDALAQFAFSASSHSKFIVKHAPSNCHECFAKDSIAHGTCQICGSKVSSLPLGSRAGATPPKQVLTPRHGHLFPESMEDLLGRTDATSQSEVINLPEPVCHLAFSLA